MKKLFTFIIFILVLVNIKGQDTVILHHKYYTSIFIKSKHIPLLVEYTLTKEMLSCKKKIKRKNNFAPDPDLPEATNINKDYVKSGYDRGHNMSAEDNTCNKEAMNECFYFSNMFPQLHSLNGGVWKKLENQERAEAKQYGKIKVFIGSIGTLKKIGPDSVVVPAYCWKVIYIESKNIYECYIFPNKKPKSSDFSFYTISIANLEQKTHIEFKKDKATIK